MKECAACVQKTIDAFGGIDVVIANAVSCSSPPFFFLSSASQFEPLRPHLD